MMVKGQLSTSKALAAAKKIVHEEGFRGLYKGALANIFRFTAKKNFRNSDNCCFQERRRSTSHGTLWRNSQAYVMIYSHVFSFCTLLQPINSHIDSQLATHVLVLLLLLRMIRQLIIFFLVFNRSPSAKQNVLLSFVFCYLTCFLSDLEGHLNISSVPFVAFFTGNKEYSRNPRSTFIPWISIASTSSISERPDGAVGNTAACRTRGHWFKFWWRRPKNWQFIFLQYEFDCQPND